MEQPAETQQDIDLFNILVLILIYISEDFFYICQCQTQLWNFATRFLKDSDRII